MKYILFTLITISLFASSASANLLIYEGFDYPADAEINGQVNPFSGETWTKPPAPAGDSTTALIASTGLDYPGLPAGVGNSLSLPRQTQSNISRITIPGAPYTWNGEVTSLFFSFAMRMTDWVTIADDIAASETHRNGDFIAGLTASGPANGMTSATVYAGQFRIRRELDESLTQTGRYELGFHKNNFSGGTDFTQWDERSFGVDETVFVVGEYEFGTNDVFDDTVRLWINPTLGEPADEPSVVVTDGYDVTTLGGFDQHRIYSFWFRDGNNFLPGPLLVDELRVGTTYESVTPAALPTAPSADFDGDGVIDGHDFLIWQRGFGISDGSALPSVGDATGDGNVGAADLAVWESQFGTFSGSAVAAVPEPGTIALTLFGLLGLALRRLH